MRFIVVLLIIVISGVAIADDTATRVAVIEKDVKLLREDVGEIKNKMVTKSEFELLCETVREIKALVNPKLEKVDGMLTWQDSHIRLHDTTEKNKDRSIFIYFGLFTAIFTAISFGKDFVISKRNGNRD